jgi:peptide deformylase
MRLTIHNYGDPVLREKAEPLTEVTEPIRKLAQDMIATMRAESGIGLAAQQVGKTMAVCVVELPPELDVDENEERMHPDVAMPLVLINPEVHVQAGAGTWTREEGCLSFPKINGKIERPWAITLSYTDLDGHRHEECPFAGMLARVILHEVDHLNGVLFIDHMSHVKKMALKGRLKRLRTETINDLADRG